MRSTWQVRCTKCGHRSDPDRAGIARPAGRKYCTGKCSRCGWTRVMAIERRGAAR